MQSAKSGISLLISCSCRVMVKVLMSTLPAPFWTCSIAGIRYAKLLPTPVPASMAKCLPALIALRTAWAI